MGELKQSIIREKKVLLILLALSVIWFLYFFYDFHVPYKFDWDLCFTDVEIQRKTIMEYTQVPLWNPFMCGGIPNLAYPQSSFFSPFFLVFLLFGTIKGTLLLHLIHVFLTLSGIYLLCRYLKLDTLPSIFAGVLCLPLFGWFSVAAGYDYLPVSLSPWILLIYLRTLNKEGGGLLSLILLLTIINLESSPYTVVGTTLFLCLYGTMEAIDRKRIRPLVICMLVLTFAFFLAAVKLFPVIDLALIYPRAWDIGKGNIINIENTKEFLLLSYKTLNLGGLYSKEDPRFGLEFVPPFVSILFFWGLICTKKNWKMVLLSLFFLFLMLGDESILNIWRLFHLLPIFSSLHFSPKFGLWFFVSFSVVCGNYLNLFNKKIHLKFAKILLFSLILSSVVFISMKQKELSFPGEIQYPDRSPAKEFYQSYGDKWKMLGDIMNGVGIVNCSSGLREQINTQVLWDEHPRYRGEVYFVFPGDANITYFSPNYLSVYVNSETENELIINQNYFSGWKSSKGDVFKTNEGLIGVKIGSFEGEIRLTYLPVSFVVGSIVSLVTLLLLIIIKKEGRFKGKQEIN